LLRISTRAAEIANGDDEEAWRARHFMEGGYVESPAKGFPMAPDVHLGRLEIYLGR
jgi:hypothetical protein